MKLRKTPLPIFCFLLAFSLGGTSAAAPDLTICSTNVGECLLSVEANDQGHTLRLRALHPQGRYCEIDKDATISILKAAFAKIKAQRREGGYASLSFGRLIDFPWLSQYLVHAASQDKGWDAQRGRPVAMDINRYVSQLLIRRELLAQLEAALAQGGYKITGCSVEKVLVGSLDEVPLYQGAREPGLFPYDAIVWLRLGKN